jgi:hypothetical protein
MVSPVMGTYVSLIFGIKQIFWVVLGFMLLNLGVAFVVKKQNEISE